MRRYQKILCAVFALVLFASELIFPIQAAAITDISRFMRQDAWAIDDECQDPGVGSIVLAGNNNVEKILNFYMRKGLNLAQASGIVGNMMQESGLKPNIVQGGRLIEEGESYTMQNGVGFGLVQWTFTGRQKPLQDHVDKMKVKNTDLGGQLSFTWVELTGPYLSTLNNLKRTNDPVEAAVVVHDGYEKSADSDSEVRSVRGGNATKVYNQYKNAPALAGSEAAENLNNPTGEEKVDEHGRAEQTTTPPQEESSSGGADGCKTSGFAGGNFDATLKAYAYPEYKGMTTKPTDAYAAAVKKAKSQGLYVGGTTYPGIDCGGFVTLLVRDSGYESGYNFNGKGGPTSAQEDWMKKNWEPIKSSDVTPGKLQPGDVAINSTHTFIWVASNGKNPDGFKAPIASASLDERAPMADNQQSPTQPGYNWYRKK
jgi:Phage tail lysozyme